MLSGIASDYTKQDVIKLAQWLIAENACHTNHVHSAMYHKQKELTAELREAQERNEHLVAANDELQERVNSLTEAYATLIGDAMNLAELNEHMPTPFHNSDPKWCAQATAAMCRPA
jgi:Mg2+ and Co2+ transporter CorA